MVFLTYIYVRYKICIKLHFFTYLISKFCKLFDQKFFFAKNVHTGNCVFYWAVFLSLETQLSQQLLMFAHLLYAQVKNDFDPLLQLSVGTNCLDLLNNLYYIQIVHQIKQLVPTLSRSKGSKSFFTWTSSRNNGSKEEVSKHEQMLL